MTTLAKTQPGAMAPDASAIEAVLVGGDLSKLSAPQRITYYDNVCASLGLNKLTKPFAYLTLNGKTVLYALRDCTDQLRKIHTVSIKVVSRETIDELIVVTTQASTPDGRTDESIGAVPIAGLKGENLANAIMKADTKAKRRVTLSICGLGMLDESELDGARAGNGGAHSPHDDGAVYDESDPDVYASLLIRTQTAEEQLPGVDSYDKALALRAYIGSAAKQSQLTRDIQAAKEARSITPDQHKELSRIWQRVNRQCVKLETDLKTDATAAFADADPEQDGR